MASSEELQLASCGDDGVRVWGASGEAVSSSGAALGACATVRWYPSGKLLAAAARSGSVSFFLRGSQSRLSELTPEAPVPRVCSADVSSGSRFVAVGAADGSLRVWDMKTRAVEARFDVPARIPVDSVSIQRTSDSRYVACAAASVVYVFSRASCRLVSRLSVAWQRPGADHGAHPPRVTAVAFSPHRVNVLVAVDDAGGVTAWDITRAKPPSHTAGPGDPSSAVVACFPSPTSAPASDLAFSPAGPGPLSLCVAGLDKRLRFFDLDARREMSSFVCPAPLTAVALTTDASVVAVGTATGAIYSYSLAVMPAVPGGRDRGATVTATEISRIPSAHVAASSGGTEPSSPAVRSLHYRPTLGPPLSTSLDAAKAKVSRSASAQMHVRSRPTVSRAHTLNDSRNPEGSFGTQLSRDLGSSATAADSPESGTAAPSGHARGARPGEFSKMNSAPDRSAPLNQEDSDLFSPVPSKPLRRTPGLGPPAVASSGEGRVAGDSTQGARSRVISSLQVHADQFRQNRRESTFIPARREDVAVRLRVPIQRRNNGDPSEDEGGDSDRRREQETPTVFSEHHQYQARPGNLGEPHVQQRSSPPLSPESRDTSGDPFANGAPYVHSSGVPSSGVETNSGQGSVPRLTVPTKSNRRVSRSSSDLRRYRDPKLPPLPPRSQSYETMVFNSNGPPDEATGLGSSSSSSSPRNKHETTLAAEPVSTSAQLEQPVSARSMAAANVEHGGVSEEHLRKLVSEEVHFAATGLRDDIKNLHAELVVSMARQEASFRALFEAKDRRVGELETLVKELRQENRQLRGVGRKARLHVPDWM